MADRELDRYCSNMQPGHTRLRPPRPYPPSGATRATGVTRGSTLAPQTPFPRGGCGTPRVPVARPFRASM